MAEVPSRSSAPRGRGSTRGRGGYSGRGGRGANHSRSATAQQATPEPSLDEQGELGQLKLQYKTEISLVKDIFPTWSDDEIVLGLQEHDNDVQRLIEQISEGTPAPILTV